MMSKQTFDVNDRVTHEDLGDGTIQNIVPHYYNKKIPQFYIVYFDNVPSMSYNMGNRECLIFPDELELL
jgi:hypothetical protein